MVNDVFLTSTLQDLITKVSLTTESIVEIWYSFALDKPKPTISIPQEEWISVLKSLNHLKNLKARSYVAAFFNGDIKIYDGKDDKKHNEVHVISKHHEDQISDALFFKCDEMGGKKYLITCSEQPAPELKICEVDTQAKSIQAVFKATEDLCQNLNGFTHLSQNPVASTVFASSSRDFVKATDDANSSSTVANLGPIQLWDINDG